MNFEARDGHDLEQRLTVEIDIFEVGVLLVIDIRICKAE